MNVTHPGAAGNKLTAALAVLALALMAANDQADAAPYSREYGYGFKRSGIETESLDTCMDNMGMERQLRSGGDLNMYLAGLARCIASKGRPRFGKRSMQQEPIYRRGVGGTESQSHSSQVDLTEEATDLSDLMDETLRLLMRGKKLAWLQQARDVLAARAQDNHM